MTNLLKEAIADSKALKQAALKNAQSLIMESMKKDLKEMVEDQMNENEEDSLDDLGLDLGAEDSGEEESGDDLESDDLATESFSESADEDDDEEVVDESISESDLQEAIREALSEVSHGGLGDVEMIDDADGKHDTGLMDVDKSEKSWADKTAPAKKNFTVKEAKALKAQVAKLVSENLVLKKTNKQLRNAVNEVNLFNTKLHYSYKIMQKEGVDPSVKQRIVKRFDAVKTVAEAKTLYESVQMAFGALSEGAKKKKTSLSEALGIPNGNGRNISESVITPKEVSAATAAADPFSKERMRHLAGIK